MDLVLLAAVGLVMGIVFWCIKPRTVRSLKLKFIGLLEIELTQAKDNKNE